MKFSTPLTAALLSSFISLSSADQITVATIYRYVNATATVYQSYCPCPATTTPGLAASTNKATSNAGSGSYVNNNAAGNNDAAGSLGTSNSAGTGSGTSAGTGSGSSNNAGTGSGAVNNNVGSNNAAAGNAVVTTYQTINVQFVPSTQLSTFTTTSVVAPGQTSTIVLTNTVVVTVPVTSTATITSTIVPSGGAGTGAGQNSAPYSNSSSTALSLSASSSLAAVIPSPISIGVSSLPSISTTVGLGGAGIGGQQNSASSIVPASSIVTVSTIPTSVSPSVGLTSTVDLSVPTSTVDVISPISLSATVVPVVSTTVDTAAPIATSVTPVSVVTTAPVPTSASDLPPTSIISSTSPVTATVNLWGTPQAGLANNLYFNTNDIAPEIYNNGDDQPPLTSDPRFVFHYSSTPGDNITIMDDFGNLLAYDATQAATATGAQLQFVGPDNPDNLEVNNFVLSSDGSAITVPGLVFTTLVLDQGFLVFLSPAPLNQYSWTAFSTHDSTGAPNIIPAEAPPQDSTTTPA